MANKRIEPADRLSLVSEYYFSRKLKEVAQLNAEGKDIISLAIGSPDMPPSEKTIEKLCEVAHQPNAHGYQPTMGTPELREAMARFYKRWYDVDLDAKTELLPLIGSKEGILHVTLAFVNPGDKVLVPNPGYPTYTSLSKILGADVVYYNLREDNGWQPDFEQLEDIIHLTSDFFGPTIPICRRVDGLSVRLTSVWCGLPRTTISSW
jgi:aspartate/methionine/tyrosine aminotransferase